MSDLEIDIVEKIFLFLCGLILILIFMFFVIFILDFIPKEQIQVYDTIEGKFYKPSYTSVHIVGKTTIIQYHPESWNIKLKSLKSSCQINILDYENSNIGDKVFVKYHNGNYTDIKYISDCEIIKNK